MPTLFDPVQLGALALSNRIIMSPLTRTRAPGELANALMREYYAQRASAGLIISEAIQICPEGRGYIDTPGLYTAEQAAAWKPVTDAVHAAGGKIVAQLWHVGRISHNLLQPGGAAPVSSSDKVAEGVKTRTAEGAKLAAQPRPLRSDEIPGVIAAYRQAARLALDAGFDGVQVHGANGYLLEQFLRDSINDRRDAYGGSIENRARLLIEVMQAVVDEVGADRTALRLSPITPANAAPQDSDAQALYTHVAARLAPLKLAFLEVVEGATGGPRDLGEQGVKPFDYAAMRQAFGGPWVVNNGYTRQMAIDTMAAGGADAVSFGRPFISNPDLVQRLRLDAPLAPINPGTVYLSDATGYTDYPSLAPA
ncbi:alkene reductase [Aquabacterium sp. OR-4]|uniref:alkene reductase n=1 Tax=Aquabacterium sp. OR-4 TaxID=2978127 RepID=UPI0021B447C0|nr:alkene reductase [Aquabacterium sp. OR-4]MDT7833698.1 alkene reductase [Aquabacterium sp. OR-4]